MRALRRIATPASVAAVLSGCTYAFEDYLPQATDAGLITMKDASPRDGDIEESGSVDTGITIVDSGVFETAPVVDTFIAETVAPDTFVEDSSKPDTCVCVKPAGINCKEWSPPGCGKD
jgi:hypothetical protein